MDVIQDVSHAVIAARRGVAHLVLVEEPPRPASRRVAARLAAGGRDGTGQPTTRCRPS